MEKLDEKQLINLTTLLKGVFTYEELYAIDLMRSNGLTLISSARICTALLEATKGDSDMKKLDEIISKISHQYSHHSVSFKDAVAATLKEKRGCSPRTIQDIRQTMNSLMRYDSDLAAKPIWQIDSSDCIRILHGAFAHSPTRLLKARATLSSVFSVSYQFGWCRENPIRRVKKPRIKEREIEILSIDALRRLFTTAHKEIHIQCLPALALMSYAGIRPEELRRLSWSDVDWEERMLYMDARHSKTGGGRHIPLPSVLIRLLRKHRQEGSICPPNWRKRWKILREAAGFKTWIPDILRHTFASYHAKMYQDLPRLQLAMGHRNCQLLLTRYINLRGLTKVDSIKFWRGFW